MEPRRQIGLLWGAAAAGLVALAPLGPALAAALPACPFRAWTGLPCLSCGTTRAALALARLEPAEAFALNPLAAVGWCLLVAGGLAAGLAALAGYPLPALRRPRLVWVRLGVGLAAAANWAYLVRFLD